MIHNFDLTIERVVDVEVLGWPEPGAAAEEGLGCNRLYCDFRGCTWTQAKRVLEFEELILERLRSANDFEETLERVEEELEELYESGDEGIYGLDLGVAACVVALSAARCIPFTSCNGGSFGDGHLEKYPLVAFYAKKQWVPELIAAAEEANAGLYSSGDALVVFAEIQDMINFARTLIARRALFRKLKLRNRCASKRRRAQHISLQQELPFTM